MSVYGTPGRVLRGSPPVQMNYMVPASVGGMNALDSLREMPPNDCLQTTNLMPSEYGLRLRKGYREYAHIETDKPVNTIIPFEGQAQSQANDRLFAVTEDGIYDVTIDGTVTNTLVATFADQNDGAGFGVWTEFTGLNEENYVYYADAVNGLWRYSESGGVWVQITEGTGADQIENVDPTTFAYVTLWKNRLWFIPRNSSTAWYLDVGAIEGTATSFTFGSKFTHGGELKAIFNWTIDGGDGIDDMLIAISRGGDVLVYQGTDPDAVSTDPLAFNMVGSYWIGEFPESRRVGMQYGGELYLLSTFGVISIRQLFQGVLEIDPAVNPSAKINRFLRPDVQDNKDSFVWSMHMYQPDGFWTIIARGLTGVSRP